MIIRIVLLIAGLLLVSAGMGLVPAVKLCGQDKRTVPLWAFACGMVCLWALFQVISLPFILKERPFSQVASVYGGCILFWILGSVVWLLIRRKKRLQLVKERLPMRQMILWGVFLPCFCSAVSGGISGICGRRRRVLCGRGFRYGKQRYDVSDYSLYRRNHGAGCQTRLGAVSGVDCVSGKAVGLSGCSDGAYRTAACADSAVLSDICISRKPPAAG